MRDEPEALSEGALEQLEVTFVEIGRVRKIVDPRLLEVFKHMDTEALVALWVAKHGRGFEYVDELSMGDMALAYALHHRACTEVTSMFGDAGRPIVRPLSKYVD